MYGIQTSYEPQKHDTEFENDVKMYGIQTDILTSVSFYQFENDVKMYGIQTNNDVKKASYGLRMM